MIDVITSFNESYRLVEVYIDGECVDTLAAQPLQVGSYYQGGIVFYINETDFGGLICSVEDLGSQSWGCAGTMIFDQEYEIGAGLQNTLDIAESCAEVPIASYMCLNYSHDGYSDWYLPSLNELFQLSTNSPEINDDIANMSDISPLLETQYWSSNQAGPYEALTVLFPSYNNSESHKENNKRVRAIRSF